MAKSPYSPEWRAMVAEEYLRGEFSSHDLSTRYSIAAKTICRWAKRYREHGISAFERGLGNTKYSAD